jgi:hypothetical protein
VKTRAKTYTDSELFNLARTGTFFHSTRTTPTPYHSRLTAGGHGGFIRVKFNSIANAALTDNGKLPLNSKISKWLSCCQRNLQTTEAIRLPFLAVMLKRNIGNQRRRRLGMGANTTPMGVCFGTVNRGADCVPCHRLTAQTSNVPGDLGHRDFVRTFGLRP